MCAMFGWFKDARVWASRVNRTSRSASLAKRSGSTLIATSRFSFVSRARYTSPMPPAPRAETISYGPSRWPGVRANCRGLYGRGDSADGITPVERQDYIGSDSARVAVSFLQRGGPVEHDGDGNDRGVAGWRVDEESLPVAAGDVMRALRAHASSDTHLK